MGGLMVRGFANSSIVGRRPEGESLRSNPILARNTVLWPAFFTECLKIILIVIFKDPELFPDGRFGLDSRRREREV
jgi:hypothetical protein